jgi:DNA-binding response OmpR family regulator
VLIIEDEPLIAVDLENCVNALGWFCVGPKRTLSDAAKAAKSEPVDAAIVDLVLNDDMAYPVLAALTERHLPFLIVTGLPRSAIEATWLDRPILEKPFGAGNVTRVLRVLVNGGLASPIPSEVTETP